MLLLLLFKSRVKKKIIYNVFKNNFDVIIDIWTFKVKGVQFHINVQQLYLNNSFNVIFKEKVGTLQHLCFAQ